MPTPRTPVVAFTISEGKVIGVGMMIPTVKKSERIRSGRCLAGSRRSLSKAQRRLEGFKWRQE